MSSSVEAAGSWGVSSCPGKAYLGMADQKTLLDTLSSFARTLTGSFSVADVLYDLADQVTGLLGLVGAGVSLVEDGSVRFVTTSSEAAGLIERIQEQQQSGPCVQAVKDQTPVLVTDLRDGEWRSRWPEYVSAALEEGVSAVAGIPMLSAEGCIGALDIYSETPRQWTEEELLTAGALATIASGYVRHASELDQQRRLAEQLQHALDSRVIIEQAKGILANHMDTSIDSAFRVLRDYSRSHSANLREVATAVVKLGLRIQKPDAGV